MQRSLFVFIALFSALCAASAQASDVVRVQVPKSIEATAGKATVAEVQVIVRPGFHVQANPVRNRFLKPIVLEVPSTRVVATGAPIYPPNKILRLEGSDEDLVIYHGTFSIGFPFTIAQSAPRGPLTLHGTLRYQACDDRHCLFPTAIPVDLEISVVGRL